MLEDPRQGRTGSTDSRNREYSRNGVRSSPPIKGTGDVRSPGTRVLAQAAKPDSVPLVSGTPGAALYLRVSTEDQSLEGQERELREGAARRGWAVVAAYKEKVSGTGKVERREYERLLADAHLADRPWTHLLVWSLDRWSREERFSRAMASIEDLEAAGVKFHSLREPTLDSSEDGTPNMGRDLLRAILPVIASFESRRRSERVRLAMAELRAGRRNTRSGNPVGRPRRVTPELATRVIELRKSGLKWREIAVQVRLPAGTCAAVASRSRTSAGHGRSRVGSPP